MSPPVAKPEAASGEVVTAVHVRYLDLPGGLPGRTERAAVLTMDNGHDHTKPNVWGPGSLRALDRALDEVLGRLDEVLGRDDLTLIALTGKPFLFSVGADLKSAAQVTDREQALAGGRYGHQVFRRLHDSAVPTFAFVNGAAMGGGLEVALHCHYRTVSADVPAVALPECFLGLVPGWGGTQLLPNLIGPEAAVTVVIENPLNSNRMLTARQAVDLGIADRRYDAPDFLEQSLAFAARVVRGEERVERREVLRGEVWAAAVARGRAIANARTKGAAPAPYRALDLLALAEAGTGADALSAGFAAEDEAVADLLLSEEFRASVYAFDLVQRRAKRPAGAPDKGLARPVTKVGIVGAGLMASQLALLFARRLEVPVVMNDLDQARIDAGVAWCSREIDGLLAKKRLSPDRANRLRSLIAGSLDKEPFSDADFVIEAVFESMPVKKQVFAEVEAVVSPEAVLATNTSSLSVTEMAADLAHPERVVGFHFFNPVAVLPLVEVVRAERTDDFALATAFAVAKGLKKSAVGVRDAPAFVVNRILTRFNGAVTAALDAGTPIPEADAALDELGLPMSPMALLGLVGPAIALHTGETLHQAFPDRFGVSEGLRRLVDAGKKGVYAPDGTVDPEVQALFPVRAGAPSREEVRESALRALAEEIRLLLDEGVVAEPQDVDLCMLLGAGWPFHLGGVTPYLDRIGVSEQVTGRPFLPPGVASLPPGVASLPA
jgi:3-hydroxyacyl-CoA dehydrogenase/enoyl-CoA hydratase/carnithine racemase